ncbi:MAG: hypothetical protein HKN81_06520 [Gammaproteobacteria bacterium]|nr:hypothetical protein [Gammaproteobacteria bacterium]NND36776.1 hypothetical protein [Gammaproteobacteria bacterium]
MKEGNRRFASDSSSPTAISNESKCGAVMATLDELARDTETRSPNLRSIVGAEYSLETGLVEFFDHVQGMNEPAESVS